MISCLSGKILQTSTAGVVVDVGGVGFLVHVPAPLRDRLHSGESVFLYTHLIVRQDALSLYGFDTSEGREFFELLLSVNGIGPKLALNVLSTLNPDTISRAVFNEQGDILSKVPGVGKKTAQKILLYLQDRLAKVEGLASVLQMSEADTEVLEALTALGYSVVEAQAALQSLPK